MIPLEGRRRSGTTVSLHNPVLTGRNDRSIPVPEISLLQPTVLRGVVERFTAPESLEMLSRVPTTPHPFPTVQWEVIRGSRAIARPNVPNSEAHIVPRLGRSSESASFVYLREKKVFEPTTLHWLRQAANNVGELAKIRAEEAVLREVKDLNQRFDNFAEFSIWQALTGKLTLDYPDVQAEVDYKFLPSHKPKVSASWATATPKQIVSDIRALKRLINRDGRVNANEAYATEKTIAYIFDAFANTGNAAVNFHGGVLLSDRMKDSYYQTGTLPGFMGLNWRPQEAVYDAAGAAYTASPTDPGQEQMFLADNALILGNFTENRPIELFIGPTADDEAPEGFTGKFAKTWKDKDPSARQYLLEWNLLPVITRPEQFVYVADVTAP